MIFVGGSLEFPGNQFYSLGYEYARLSGINQGIVPTIASFSTFYLLVASYFLFKQNILPL